MENKEKIIRNPLKIFLFEEVFFIFAQVFGIFSALRVLEIVNAEKISLKPVSFFDFILGFALATLFILLLIKFLKLKPGKIFIFRILFIFVISLGSLIFLSLWLGDLLGLFFLIILIFLWLKSSNLLVHNFLVLSGIIGIGSVFGLRLEPLMVVLFLILFSIYDFVAVYKTKHMVKMAEAMIEAKAILGIVLPPSFTDFKAKVKEIYPGGKFLILGGGDIIFPLLLSVSLVPQGISKSLVVSIFAAFGLGVSFYFFISQKIRKPIPALPPIALFSIVGFLLTIFL